MRSGEMGASLADMRNRLCREYHLTGHEGDPCRRRGGDPRCERRRGAGQSTAVVSLGLILRTR